MDNHSNALESEQGANEKNQEELIIKKLDLLVEGSKNQIKHLYYVNKTLSSINDKLTLIIFILILPFIISLITIILCFALGYNIFSLLF